MNTYVIYKLTKPDSVIGFPFVAFSQEDGKCISLSNDVICVDTNFSNNVEADINLYLEDYTSTEQVFSFDIFELIEGLDINKEDRRITVVTMPPYQEFDFTIFPKTLWRKLIFYITLFLKLNYLLVLLRGGGSI